MCFMNNCDFQGLNVFEASLLVRQRSGHSSEDWCLATDAKSRQSKMAGKAALRMSGFPKMWISQNGWCLYGCESKCKAPIHTLNPQADLYPRSIPKRRWSRPIHTSGSPRADPYPNFDATPYCVYNGNPRIQWMIQGYYFRKPPCEYHEIVHFQTWHKLLPRISA